LAGKTAILALTRGGTALGERLAGELPQARVFSCGGQVANTLHDCWHNFENLVCIMAAGIVVRSLAPLLEDKRTDPAVVVCDEQGRFAVSLLSGHLGGGNELARRVADILGGQAVITTASDVLGHTALDLWARDLGLAAADTTGLTRAMGKLVNRGQVSVYSEVSLPDLPADLVQTDDLQNADLVISCRTDLQTPGTLLHPKILIAGIGCNRNTPADEIEQALQEACEKNHLARASIGGLASIDLKSDEPGLLAFAAAHGYPITFFHRDQLNAVEGVATSAAVLKATGARGVAEPAAVLAAGGGRLLVGKMKWPNVTVAVAERNSYTLEERKQDNP
jgi:cobalt-precorrin 5A hydrolase